MSNGNGEEPDDDAVGYGRPPRQSRWKKGQSGNPSGRPKGTRGLKTDLRAELISRMEISMNGKRVSGTKQQLMLRTLTARAAAGDVKATRTLIDLVMRVFGPEDQGSGPKSLSRTDQQILDELLGRQPGPSVTADARPQDWTGTGGNTHGDAMSTNSDPDNEESNR
jgi:hypothetical protein